MSGRRQEHFLWSPVASGNLRTVLTASLLVLLVALFALWLPLQPKRFLYWVYVWICLLGVLFVFVFLVVRSLCLLADASTTWLPVALMLLLAAVFCWLCLSRIVSFYLNSSVITLQSISHTHSHTHTHTHTHTHRLSYLTLCESLLFIFFRYC